MADEAPAACGQEPPGGVHRLTQAFTAGPPATGDDSSLIGRDKELSRIRELLAPPYGERRVLVLLGDPGVGKSVLLAALGTRSEALRAGRASGCWPRAGRPVGGEPVPVGCHAFAVPGEPPPAPCRPPGSCRGRF